MQAGRTDRAACWGAVCAIDSGSAVDPDGIRNQREGVILQAASWTLYEQVRFERTRITSRDWRTYPIMRGRRVRDRAKSALHRPVSRHRRGRAGARCGGDCQCARPCDRYSAASHPPDGRKDQGVAADLARATAAPASNRPELSSRTGTIRLFHQLGNHTRPILAMRK